MDQKAELVRYRDVLQKRLKLSNNFILTSADNNRRLLVDIQYPYNMEKKVREGRLFLAYTEELETKTNIEKDTFYFTSKDQKILECGGTLYSKTNKDVFYQLAVSSRDCQLMDRSIFEFGFKVCSLYEYTERIARLYLNIDIEGGGFYTSVIDFITFPALLKAILAASKTGKYIKNESGSLKKIIQWEDVILPEDYKKFSPHPWSPFEESFSFDRFFFKDFRDMCQDKYEKQQK